MVCVWIIRINILVLELIFLWYDFHKSWTATNLVVRIKLQKTSIFGLTRDGIKYQGVKKEDTNSVEQSPLTWSMYLKYVSGVIRGNNQNPTNMIKSKE
jgi:hypothetical protein